MVDVLLRDDFARKIQALAGMAAEPDYRPKQLGIIPLYFLLSISSVKSTVQGLLLGRGASSIESVKVYHDGMILIGMMLGMLLSLLVICPTLIWTTILAWQVSPLLFTFDVIASVLTVLLLTWRPVAAAIRRRFVPSGLYLHECAGAFHFV